MSEPSSSGPEPVEPTPEPPAATPRRATGPRIGDADRDRAVSYLREHLSAGRLDAVEFEDRMGQALEARTSADLAPLFEDLPDPRPPTAEAAPAFQAPPWQRQSAPTPAVVRAESREVAEQPRPMNTALAIATSVAWPVTILAITFGLGWSHFWWLVFIPIVLSSLVGKGRQDRHRHQHGH